MSDSDAVHDPSTETASTDQTAAPAVSQDVLDLDRIERDLADVEVALARLDSGDYWRDEVTGAELDEAFLAEHPTARRGAPSAHGGASSAHGGAPSAHSGAP